MMELEESACFFNTAKLYISIQWGNTSARGIFLSDRQRPQKPYSLQAAFLPRSTLMNVSEIG